MKRQIETSSVWFSLMGGGEGVLIGIAELFKSSPATDATAFQD